MALAQPNTKQSALMHRAAALTPLSTQTPAQLVHIKGPGSDDGLDDLISGHAAQRLDEKRKIEAVGDGKFEELVRKYELYLMRKDYFIKNDHILDGIEDVMAPKYINDFLQTTVVFEDYEKYSNGTGKFISRLIRNSYHAGYNNFVLNTKSQTKRLNDLGEDFCGLPYRMIYVQIDGNIGNDCGSNANFSSFTINGNDYGGCGIDVYNSSFIINGDMDEWGFWEAKYSSFIINGMLNSNEFAICAASCTFKTPNKKTLDKLLEYTPFCKNHKIYFINPDGTEELMRTN